MKESEGRINQQSDEQEYDYYEIKDEDSFYIADTNDIRDFKKQNGISFDEKEYEGGMREKEEKVSEKNRAFFRDPDNGVYSMNDEKEGIQETGIWAGDVQRNSQDILSRGMRVDISSKNEEKIYQSVKEEAANLIIAELLTKKRNFEYGGMLHQKKGPVRIADFSKLEPLGEDEPEVEVNPVYDKSNERTILDSKELNERINTYKKHLYQDESFKTAVSQIVSKKMKSPEAKGATSIQVDGMELVSAYKKARKAELDDKMGHHYYDDTARGQLPEKKVKLSSRDRRVLSELQQEMFEYNHGQVRKGVNKKMMDALKNVLKNDSAGSLTMQDLDELRKRSARYYTDRKGTFFGPQTGEGKNRLNASARIFRTADRVFEKLAQQEFDKMTEAAAENAKKEEQLEQQRKLEEEKKAKLHEQKNKEFLAAKQEKKEKGIEKTNEDFHRSLKNYNYEKKFTEKKDRYGKEITPNGLVKIAASLYMREYINEAGGIPVKENGKQVELTVMLDELCKSDTFRKAIGIPENKKGLQDKDFDAAKKAVTERTKDGKLKMRQTLVDELPCLKGVKQEQEYKKTLPQPKAMG